MAEVGYKSSTPVLITNVNGVKIVGVLVSTMTTGDVITMTGAAFKMSTIVYYDIQSHGHSTFAGTVHAQASNVISVNGTSGVQSCMAFIVGF